MIRYTISEAELRKRIELEKPGWLARAESRTRRFLALGEYDERSSIWSEVKTVYMRLQHDKCAYCERQLAAEDLGGTIEHDLEHYRPKNTVETWPTESISEERRIAFNFSTGDGYDDGYYWLAYEPLNYCTSCKKCNSPLKRNYFPIAGQRGKTGEVIGRLNDTERPFLPYPLGDVDEDPEDVITFDGVIAIPRKRNGPRWRRAKVTIAFFQLNLREELLRERARSLVALDNALAILESDSQAERVEQAQEDVRRLRSTASPHAGCVRAACQTYVENRARFLEIARECRRFLAAES